MGLQHACLPVDWRRKALPCLSKPAAASRLNKLARKPAAAHPGPRGGGGGAGRRLRQAEGWCADAGQSRTPAAGEGMLPGAGCGSRSCRPPFPWPGVRERCSDSQPSSPRNGKCCVGSVLRGRSLPTFRCFRRWGKVAFWFRFLCRLPPPFRVLLFLLKVLD